MAFKPKTAAVPGLKTVLGQPTGANLPSAYLGGLTSIGAPGINAVRAAAQTAGMAKRAVTTPRAPTEARSPISKIRVRRKRFRFAPPAPAGGFTVGQPEY